jgi:hypothetical protein
MLGKLYSVLRLIIAVVVIVLFAIFCVIPITFFPKWKDALVRKTRAVVPSMS